MHIAHHGFLLMIMMGFQNEDLTWIGQFGEC